MSIVEAAFGLIFLKKINFIFSGENIREKVTSNKAFNTKNLHHSYVEKAYRLHKSSHEIQKQVLIPKSSLKVLVKLCSASGEEEKFDLLP